MKSNCTGGKRKFTAKWMGARACFVLSHLAASKRMGEQLQHRISMMSEQQRKVLSALQQALTECTYNSAEKKVAPQKEPTKRVRASTKSPDDEEGCPTSAAVKKQRTTLLEIAKQHSDGLSLEDQSKRHLPCHQDRKELHCQAVQPEAMAAQTITGKSTTDKPEAMPAKADQPIKLEAWTWEDQPKKKQSNKLEIWTWEDQPTSHKAGVTPKSKKSVLCTPSTAYFAQKSNETIAAKADQPAMAVFNLFGISSATERELHDQAVRPARRKVAFAWPCATTTPKKYAAWARQYKHHFVACVHTSSCLRKAICTSFDPVA